MKSLLALEDGTVFHGRSFTGECDTVGEVVFNTSMSGYQEILTDPSYCGQIVTMTYPLIGNYGINHEDIESARIQVKGFIVKEYQEMPSNWRSESSLADYLNEANIPGIEGIDTRALTRHIRLEGAMKGAISTKITDPDELIEVARKSPGIKGMDLVKEVTCSKPMLWRNGKAIEIKEDLDDFTWPEVYPETYTMTVGIGEGTDPFVHTIHCWAHNIVSVEALSPGRGIHGIFNNPIQSCEIRELTGGQQN